MLSTDLADDIGTLHPGARYVRADLTNLEAMVDLLKGADMGVHFGAVALGESGVAHLNIVDATKQT